MSDPILSQEEINALMAALQSEMEEGEDDSAVWSQADHEYTFTISCGPANFRKIKFALWK